MDPVTDIQPAGMTQEEMQSNLANLKNAVEDKFREMNSNQFINKNSSDAIRKEGLQEALKILKRAGIDLNDPESVRKFLSDLEAVNPDIFQLFEEAFNYFLEGEDMPEQPADPNLPPTGPMPAIPPVVSEDEPPQF